MKKRNLIDCLPLAIITTILFFLGLSMSIHEEFMDFFTNNFDLAKTFFSTSSVCIMVFALYLLFKRSK